MDAPEASAAKAVTGSRTYLILGALIVGILAGAGVGAVAPGVRSHSLATASAIGGLWLNALRMTVIPLIIALLVNGVAKGADAARSGRIAARSIAWFLIIYIVSSTIGAVITTPLITLIPLPTTAVQAIRTGIAAISNGAQVPTPSSIGDFFRNIVPSNITAAATNGDVLQIVIFTLLFALAIASLPQAKARPLTNFFDSLGDALLIVIGWVLWIAPVGVFALAFAVGASAGGAALGGVLHYVIIITLSMVPMVILAYLMAIIGGRLPPRRFVKAMITPQALAFSTQSSLACLPPMLVAARTLGIREKVADVTLPLAVALFRATGPASNIAVPIYLAHVLGIHLGLTQYLAGIAVATIIEFGSVSLPGQLTYFTINAPIAVAMGVPIAPLLLFVAVDTIPDILRTIGNVTMDVAVTATVARSEAGPDYRPAIARTRSE